MAAKVNDRFNGAAYALDMDNAVEKQWRIGNAYEMREWLRELGGRWEPQSKTWVLTQAQYDRLYDMYEISSGRSNKRDRALAVAYDKCTVTGEEVGA